MYNHEKENMKNCNRCHILKELNCFNNRKVNPDGLDNRCKACEKELYDIRMSNPEKRARHTENVKKYFQLHPEQNRKNFEAWLNREGNRAIHSLRTKASYEKRRKK